MTLLLDPVRLDGLSRSFASNSGNDLKDSIPDLTWRRPSVPISNISACRPAFGPEDIGDVLLSDIVRRDEQNEARDFVAVTTSIDLAD